MTARPRLEVQDLTVRYGDVAAVENLSFALEAGTITGLIGPNGAGKTSVLEALSGFVPLSSGRILIDGVVIDGMAPHRRAALGLGRTFQTLELFEDLTVEENLLVAGHRRDERGVSEALALGLEPVVARLPTELSHARRALVALGRALVGRPFVLLLDEPAAGLDQPERQELGRRLRQLAGDGMAILLVEHDTELVFDVARDVLVLDAGREMTHGPAKIVAANRNVIDAYLGQPLASPAQPPPSPAPGAGGPSLELRDVTAGYAGVPVIAGVSLTVSPGEVVALVGLNGTGKTTTLSAAAGVLSPMSGSVRLHDKDVTGTTAHHRARQGMAHVPQAPSLFTGLTVEENLRLGRLKAAGVRPALDLFPALSGTLGRTAGTLSGGEQRMVALARALGSRPQVLLIDEMSLGLSPGATERLVNGIRSLAGDGTAVLVVDQHRRVTDAMADRTCAMSKGRISP